MGDQLEEHTGPRSAVARVDAWLTAHPNAAGRLQTADVAGVTEAVSALTGLTRPDFSVWWSLPTPLLSGETPKDLVRTQPARVLHAAVRFVERVRPV